MIIYLTYNDAPSGIYNSQVIDTCFFLNEKLETRVRLMALVSLRKFFAYRKKIQTDCPGAIVLPMVPRVKNWRMNFFWLRVVAFLIKPDVLICRGVFAASLGLKLKKKGGVSKVCYDGRGAVAAEYNEYEMVSDQQFRKEVLEIEQEAVMQSDTRVAVSQKLVDYWQDQFCFELSMEHVVIPCTLSSVSLKTFFPNRSEITRMKQKAGFDPDDIVLAYSGSMAGWQSFAMISGVLDDLLKTDRRIRVLFLTPGGVDELAVFQKYSERIFRKWVQPHKVNELLMACDYGLLLREESVTNKVAAPTKFAEYLLAGLPVIISDNIGDYSEFIRKNDCGIVISQLNGLEKVPYKRKQKLHGLAKWYFSKEYFVDAYKKIGNFTAE